MSTKLPLIGLVCGHQSDHPERYYVNNTYIQAILSAGGTPILIPYQAQQNLRQTVALLDGLLLPGGIDIDPTRYKQNPAQGCGRIDPLWDQLDFAALDLALERNLPVLAICRGMQVLNVAYGGSLIQDIPTQIEGAMKHRQEAPGWHPTHTFDLMDGCLLTRIWADAPTRINSFHHQSVSALGRGLRVSAAAPDGVIEAVEAVDRKFVLGVQWHPELMVEHCKGAQRIFMKFIEAASGN